MSELKNIVGFKLILTILTCTVITTACGRSAFESSKPTTVSTFSNVPACEEITGTNAYIEWCNQNELTSTEVRQVCYGLAYISGKYRKILKVASYDQPTKCYAQLSDDKNTFIPECDSAFAQIYNSLSGEENLNVFECQQKHIGIFYIHAIKNSQKLFTVFSK